MDDQKISQRLASTGPLKRVSHTLTTTETPQSLKSVESKPQTRRDDATLDHVDEAKRRTHNHRVNEVTGKKRSHSHSFLHALKNDKGTRLGRQVHGHHTTRKKAARSRRGHGVRKSAGGGGGSHQVLPAGKAVASGNFQALRGKLATMGITSQKLHELSQKYGVPVNMILGVIMQESHGNPNAHSGVGAQGLMQLMPGTAKSLGVRNSLDPMQNVEGGVKYLGQLMKMFHGDTAKVLAGYNSGPGNVKKFHGVPPFKETRQYVANIMAWMPHAGGDT